MIKRLKFICFFVITLLALKTNAQKISNITATFNPFSFADTDAGITPGVGFNFSKHFSFYSDAGFIFSSPYQANNSKNEIRGYKFKPAIRYFFRSKDSTENIPIGGFLEMEFLIKHVGYNKYDEIGIANNLGIEVYKYIGGYKIIKNVSGITLKYGYRLYFSKKKKFGSDIYFGLGLKKRTVKTKGLPDGAIINQFMFENNELNLGVGNGNQSDLPNFAFGMKLIYRFN